ncbi:MAG: efflux RND transporter periplasmic adaptor subunit [Desulfarculaceae bacterium]
MKLKVMLRVLLVLIILGGGGYAVWHFALEKPAEPSNLLTLYGNVEHRQVQLAFQATGRVQRLTVDEGDTVEAGRLLAELDPVRYQAQLAKAEAELAVREQELSRLLAGARPEEIAQARADMSAAQADYSDAKLLYQRQKSLFSSRSISRQNLDNATARFESAQARLKKAKEALKLLIKGPREEDIAAARAALRAAKAAAELSRRELVDTRLLAPKAGVIEQRILETGDMAFPQTPVFTLAIMNPVWVRAYLPESVLGKVKPGMSAKIFSDSYPDKSYAGWVGFISPTAEFTPKQVETPNLRTKLVYRARIFSCNPRHELRLGMPVTVKLDLTAPAQEPLPDPDQRCGAR